MNKIPKSEEGLCRLFYEYKLVNSKGKVKRHKKAKSHSFVIGLLQLLFSNMGICEPLITEVDSTTFTPTVTFNPNNLISLSASVGSDSSGLWVGTSNTAVAINNTNLGAKVAHGTSSGQLQYSAVSFGAPTSDSTSTSFIVSRVFSNASGGSIVVREIGLVSSNASGVLIARDVLGTPPTVANGEQLTVDYTIQTNL